MIERSSIFYRMTCENEDATSELLVNLMREKYLRDIVLRWFLKNLCNSEKTENIQVILDKIHASDIKTQESSEYGRPDIVIETSENYFIIENKIRTRTDLQNNQIENYKKLLQKKSRARNALFFLVPKGYVHEQELKNLKESEPELVFVCYWNDLLEYLYEQEIAKTSPVVAESLEYLKNTIDTLNQDAFETILKPYEVAMLYSPKEIYSVFALSEKILKLSGNFVEGLKNKLTSKVVPGKPQENKVAIGRYFHVDNSSYFIGLNQFMANVSSSYEDFVFSICVFIEKDAFIKKADETMIKDGQYINLWTDKKDGTKYLIQNEGGGYYVYLPLDKKCLLDDDSSLQQEEFNKAALAVLQKLFEISKKFMD